MTRTLLISRKRRMPLGEEESKTMHWPLLDTNSAMNLSSGVVTSGVSAHASRHARIVGKCCS